MLSASHKYNNVSATVKMSMKWVTGNRKYRNLTLNRLNFIDNICQYLVKSTILLLEIL